MIELSLTWHLIKKETKMDGHSIESRGLLWKCFCEFLVIWMLLLFMNNYINGAERSKSVGTLWWRWTTSRTFWPKLESIKKEVKHTPEHTYTCTYIYYKKPIIHSKVCKNKKRKLHWSLFLHSKFHVIK